MESIKSAPSVGIKVKRLLQDPKGVLIRKKHALKRRFDPVVREQDRLSQMTGPSGYWDELRAYQLSFMKRMGLMPSDRLLDIACGPLQGGIAFIEYLDRSRYCGIDVCEKAVSEAYKQVLQYDLVKKNPTLVRSDSFGLDEIDGRQFDFAWCCQTMYIFEEPVMDRFFKAVATHLRPGGQLFGDILGASNTEAVKYVWHGYRQILYTPDSVERLARRHGLVMTRVGPIHEYGYPVPCGLRDNEMLRFEKA